MEPARTQPMREAVIDELARRRVRARRLHGLYAVTPDLHDTALLVAKVRAALEGGAAALQYRNKTADDAQRRAQAQALARVHAARGALLIVNDDPRLAREVDADGVHLGEDDGSIAAAREVVGSDRLVGVSCYDDVGRARIAVEQGADYVAFGSFFASSTKPGARNADIALLASARTLGVPVVAIGGITSANAAQLIAAGADAVAVISDVFGREVEDVSAAAQAIARLFPTSSRPMS
jgi:thiamine-phosphate pyrophosphorylase